MPNELTKLLKVASRGPRTTCAALFMPDLACAALCTMFKLLAYWLKYFILFHPSGQASFVSVLIICEILNCMVSILWWEIVLSFEAAVFKRAHAAFVDFEQSNEAKKAAFKANRKATSITDTIQASLGLIVDQSITSFAAFSKAGCNWPFACGASVAMLCFPLLLQLRSMRLVTKVSAQQRQKETEIGQECVFVAYGNLSRALRLSNFRRRICVLLAFGFLVFIANPDEPQTFVLVLPLVFHTDEKLAKLWKASADAESAWKFLQMQALPDQNHHQDVTYDSIMHPQPETMPRMRVSGAAREAAQVLWIWMEGSEYKIETIGTSNGFRWRNSARKNFGDDADED